MVRYARRTDARHVADTGKLEPTRRHRYSPETTARAAPVTNAACPAARAASIETSEHEKSKPAQSAPLVDHHKDERMTGLSLRPLVVETPAHLLDDDTTPISKFFIRCNGQIPDPTVDIDSWLLTIDGEVDRPLTITLRDLKRQFASKTYRMVLECGGNGRSYFQPPANGLSWTNGGAGCAEWTGVSLAELLAAAKVRGSAKYTAHSGVDLHLSGNPAMQSLSRGMPLAKALDKHTLVVYGMNGEPLPNVHGGPLRLIVPGWPGSLSQKWLAKITLRDREHDGQGMTGQAYRLPVEPIVPGSSGDGALFRVLESMPIRAVITFPADGVRIPAGFHDLSLRGAAWGGDIPVSRVDVTIDGGQTWIEAKLAPLKNRYDWNRWTAKITLPSNGYYEICARATDIHGKTQPTLAANWNPLGYAGNAQHRISILVG